MQNVVLECVKDRGLRKTYSVKANRLAIFCNDIDYRSRLIRLRIRSLRDELSQ